MERVIGGPVRTVNVTWRLVILMLLTTTFLGLTWTRAGAAPTLGGFIATASAQGGRATFTVPDFAVVETIVDAGGPVSQSAIDPSSALSFASMPYPGDLVISGPGLFAGLTGIQVPGQYPFYVSASHPTTPEQAVEDPTGAYQLLAKASSGSASSVAKAQGQAGEGASALTTGARSSTSSIVHGDTVTATAETVNEALDFGQAALRIASVRSKSVTTYTAGQPEPVTKTELAIDGGSAGGNSFSFGPEGLKVAGQGIPIPAGNGLDQLNAALEPAGIALRFAGVQKLAGGASADTLLVSLAGQAPIPGIPPGVITLQFGGAASAVTLGTGADGFLPPATDVVSGGDETFPPAASPAGSPGDAGAFDGSASGDSATVPVASGGVPLQEDGFPSGAEAVGIGGGFPAGAGSGSAGRSGDASGEATPSAAVAGESAGTSTTGESGLAQPVLHPRKLGSDGILYWVIIGAGMLLLTVSSLWRAKGVLSL